jgi:hypothetical protein
VWKKTTAPSKDAWETEESASKGSSEHETGAQPEVEEEAYTPVEFVYDEHLKDTWGARDRYQRPAKAVPSSKCPPTGAGILLRDRSLRNRAYERGECTKAERDATALSQIGLKPTPTPAQEETTRDKAWIKILRCIRTTRLWSSREWGV